MPYLLAPLYLSSLYKDSAQPSNKLPVAESVRTVVRKKSNAVREQIYNSHSLQRVRTGSERSFQTLRTFTHPKLSKSVDKFDPVEEAPETSLDEDYDQRSVHRGPYMQHSGSDRGKRAMLISPFGATSQVTLANPISQPADSTVRLVTEDKRFTIRRDSSASGSDSGSRSHSRSRSRSRSRPRSLSRSPTYRSGSGEDSCFESEGEQRWRRRDERGRSRTPVSEVLSAYYQDRGTVIEHDVPWATKELVDVDRKSVV